MFIIYLIINLILFENITETVQLVDRYGVSIVVLVICLFALSGVFMWMRKMIDKQNTLLFTYIENRDKQTLEVFNRNHEEIKEVIGELKRVIDQLPKRR
jgi:TctA family transporter